jgi:hypothetical protein
MNMGRKNYFILMAGFCFFLEHALIAQTLPLNVPLSREMVQRGQLSGIIPVKRSGNLWPASYRSMFSFDLGVNMDTVKNSFFSFMPLPVVSKQRITSRHPDGMNDGIMIPAKGFQTYWSAGLFLKAGPIEIQAMPEYVYAQNASFEEESFSYGPNNNNLYRAFMGSIDVPVKFGNEPYKKFGYGQSSVKLAVGPLAAGLSNENIWWGPGRNNAIMMSNNAPGFLHATFLTRKPLVTPIGNIEFEVIGGYLRPSEFTGKSVKKVYLNSGMISFQPRFLPGLSGGLTRSFLQQPEKYSSWRGYMPVLSGITKVSLGGTEEDKIQRNQLLSVFARYLLPKSQAEFYFEFGKEDHNWDLRDIILEYAHSRVYLWGFRKLIPLNVGKNQYLKLDAEISNFRKPLMTANRNNGLFSAVDIYSYGSLNGYTLQGQYIGAGIGSGGSQALLEISWIKGMKRIGLMADRRVHEADYSDGSWPGNTQFRWVDLSVTPVVDWDFNRFLLHFTARNVRSLNYRHQFTPRLNESGESTFKGKGKYNLLAELQVAYFLHKPSKN